MYVSNWLIKQVINSNFKDKGKEMKIITLKNISLLIPFILLTSCGETPEECLRNAIKESPTDIAMKFAAIECARDHPELLKKK